LERNRGEEGHNHMNLRIKSWIVIMGCVFLSFGLAYGQVADEPGERIKLGKEGKSIQAELPAQEQYTYIPGERRDPFVSLILRGEDMGAFGDEITPLQKVDVNELKLVGIVKNPEGNMALIQTPDGKGYFLRKGLRVGKNEGIVAEVLEDQVIVKEKRTDFLGQISVEEAVLKLKKEEGNR
jgi:type IV pilus assembly protein PilP